MSPFKPKHEERMNIKSFTITPKNEEVTKRFKNFSNTINHIISEFLRYNEIIQRHCKYCSKITDHHLTGQDRKGYDNKEVNIKYWLCLECNKSNRELV
jgi:hypothetical protein